MSANFPKELQNRIMKVGHASRFGSPTTRRQPASFDRGQLHLAFPSIEDSFMSAA